MYSLKKISLFLFVFIFSASLYCQEYTIGQEVKPYGTPYRVVYIKEIKNSDNETHEIVQLKNKWGEDIIMSIRTTINEDGTSTRHKEMYDFDEAVEEDFFLGLALASITIPVQIVLLPIRFMQSKSLEVPKVFMFEGTPKNVLVKAIVSLGLAGLLEKYI